MTVHTVSAEFVFRLPKSSTISPNQSECSYALTDKGSLSVGIGDFIRWPPLTAGRHSPQEVGGDPGTPRWEQGTRSQVK